MVKKNIILSLIDYSLFLPLIVFCRVAYMFVDPLKVFVVLLPAIPWIEMSSSENVPNKNVKGDITESYRRNLLLLSASWSFREFQLINCPAFLHVITFSSLTISPGIPDHSSLRLSGFVLTYLLLEPGLWRVCAIECALCLMDTLKGTLLHKKTAFNGQLRAHVAFPWPFLFTQTSTWAVKHGLCLTFLSLPPALLFHFSNTYLVFPIWPDLDMA